MEEVKKAYSEIRNERAEERFLRPLELNYQTYLQAQSAFAPDVAFQLAQQLTGYELGLHIVIAGVDGSGGHLYMVADPGTAECFDALGLSPLVQAAVTRMRHSLRIRTLKIFP